MAEEEDARTAARRAGDTETWDARVLTDLMAKPEGRYFVERLLDLCGARHALYGNDGDALGMAWRDGKAEIGRYLETQLETHCPDRYLQMVRERRQRYERERKQAARDMARRDGGENHLSGFTIIDEMAERQKAEAQKPKPKEKK